MKLTRIEITGFRGALPPLPLELNEKSLFIYGENGRGKSTISDALELWSTGKLETFRREKCGLDAAIHVDATEATIEVLPEGSGLLKRTLRGSSVSGPEPRDNSGDPSHALGLPLLRHETVRNFIEKSPGDKKREILALVGLEGLNDFRDAIRTAKSETKRVREEAERMTKAEERRLSDKTTGRDTVEVAEELRVGAKLPSPITDLDELRNRSLQTATAAATPDRPGEVEKLARVLEDALRVDLQPWDDLIADQESVTRKAVATLVREGRSVLPHWREESCPLCLQEYPGERLATELEERIAGLADIEARFSDAEAPLVASIATWRSLKGAIEAVSRIAPEGGWSNSDSLKAAQAAASDHADSLETASRDLSAAPPSPMLTLSGELDSMRGEASTGVSPEQAAQTSLALLKEQQERVDEASARLAAAVATEKSADALLEIAERKVGAAITEAISGLGDLVAAYYLKVSGSKLYSNVRVEYDGTHRAGGTEFSIRYDDREDFSPPQRIMSNGQLNALALAFFLARTKVEGGQWRTIVLDDVVGSFGGIHRQGLLGLLEAEFSDWQIILLTHDRTFARHALVRLGSGWEHQRIDGWSPKGGPVLVSGNPLELLRKRLAEGKGPDELGGVARQAFELELSRPLEKLMYSIEYHSNGRYAAMEYLIALRRGLKAAKSSIADEGVFARLEADSFVINLTAHDQPILDGAETADFDQLVKDLAEVRSLFKCEKCGDSAWTRGERAGKHTCGCKALSA
jgi:hypothetical protein